ncbi:hypothetical protein Ancab_030249 [Ancistrocladus abbreviatus]
MADVTEDHQVREEIQEHNENPRKEQFDKFVKILDMLNKEDPPLPPLEGEVYFDKLSCCTVLCVLASEDTQLLEMCEYPIEQLVRLVDERTVELWHHPRAVKEAAVMYGLLLVMQSSNQELHQAAAAAIKGILLCDFERTIRVPVLYEAVAFSLVRYPGCAKHHFENKIVSNGMPLRPTEENILNPLVNVAVSIINTDPRIEVIKLCWNLVAELVCWTEDSALLLHTFEMTREMLSLPPLDSLSSNADYLFNIVRIMIMGSTPEALAWGAISLCWSGYNETKKVVAAAYVLNLLQNQNMENRDIIELIVLQIATSESPENKLWAGFTLPDLLSLLLNGKSSLQAKDAIVDMLYELCSNGMRLQVGEPNRMINVLVRIFKLDGCPQQEKGAKTLLHFLTYDELYAASLACYKDALKELESFKAGASLKGLIQNCIHAAKKCILLRS